MARFNINAAVGLADDESRIWPSTRAAIERLGYQITAAPGQPNSKLGGGAFAVVFYAEHVVNKRPVAREFAQAIYQCCHEAGAQPFLVLEHIRGTTIDRFAADRCPSWDERSELLEELLHGLRLLHERNLTHRDVSASNVLVDQRSKVRFLDFGEAGEIVRNTQHTTLNPLGNPVYSPGEQKNGEKRAGPEDGIYNCAMIAVHVLTGTEPPANLTRSGDREHLARCAKQLREARVPAGLRDVVLRGLRAPKHRYQTAQGMAEALFSYRVRRPQRRPWCPPCCCCSWP